MDNHPTIRTNNLEPNQTQFNVGTIQPVECVKEAWELIKETYWLFFGITAVGILIGSLFAIILMGPMMCGIYFCVFKRMRGEKIEFGDLFRGFDYFLQSLIATLLQTIPIIVIFIPFYLIIMIGMFRSMAAAGASGEPNVGLVFSSIILWVLVIMLISVLVNIFCMFTYPLIVDRKLSGIDALRTSISAAWANIGSVVVLAILTFVMGMVGVLLCYVGALFVLPVTITAHAVAYRKIFPMVPAVSPSPIA